MRREAPWVLSDVLRAKRKSGVEGRGEREIVMASRRGCERMRGGGGGGGGRGSGKNPRALSPGAHTGAPRMRRVPAIGGEWWGGAQRAEAPLPCRLGLLLDDHPETRLMGPVGAPEIPTRTGHNARLKVGSTTDGKAPMDATTFKQGRTVTSPDLLPALPFSLLLPRPSMVFLLHASPYLLCLVRSSSSSADSSATLSSTFLWLLLSS